MQPLVLALTRQVMRLRPEQIDNLAGAIVSALLQKGFVRAKADEKTLQRKVSAVLTQNLEEEAALEAEAEQMALEYLRKNEELDRRKLVQGIKARLAQERGFVL